MDGMIIGLDLVSTRPVHSALVLGDAVLAVLPWPNKSAPGSRTDSPSGGRPCHPTGCERVRRLVHACEDRLRELGEEHAKAKHRRRGGPEWVAAGGDRPILHEDFVKPVVAV